MREQDLIEVEKFRLLLNDFQLKTSSSNLQDFISDCLSDLNSADFVTGYGEEDE